MKASNFLDKTTKKPLYSPIGYYVSEKFDGQRAQWDPINQILITRYGNVVNAPQWFLDYFKNIKIPLDGEIFFGYGNWGMTGVCRNKTSQTLKINNDIWKKANFLVFDLPDTQSGIYEKRISILEQCSGIGKWGTTDTPIWLIRRKKVLSMDMLEIYYQQIQDRGGEGVILNNPKSFYVDGRTDNMLKYKPIMDDECIIVGYKPGAGRNAGLLGSFIVHPIEDGLPIPHKEFHIGSGLSDLLRSGYIKSHPIGTILRYCFTEYTKTGKPRFPRYLGICKKPVTKDAEIKTNIANDPKAHVIHKIRPKFKLRPEPLKLSSK